MINFNSDLKIDSRCNRFYCFFLLFCTIFFAVIWIMMILDCIKGHGDDKEVIVSFMGILMFCLLAWVVLFRWTARFSLYNKSIAIRAFMCNVDCDLTNAISYLIYHPPGRFIPFAHDLVWFFDDQNQPIGSIPWIWKDNREIENFFKGFLKQLTIWPK